MIYLFIAKVAMSSEGWEGRCFPKRSEISLPNCLGDFEAHFASGVRSYGACAGSVLNEITAALVDRAAVIWLVQMSVASGLFLGGRDVFQFGVRGGPGGGG
jgi:hypothetical protein